MSVSIDDVKKFLESKAKGDDTETRRVVRVGGTDHLVEQYKVLFITPAPEEPKPKKVEAAKIVPKAAPKADSKGKK